MPNILDPKKWATGPATSAMYGPAPRTLQDWAKRDLIVSVTIGRVRYYSIDSLDELFAKALEAQPKYRPRRVPWDDPPMAPQDDPQDDEPLAVPAAPSRKTKQRMPVRRRRPARAAVDLVTSS